MIDAAIPLKLFTWFKLNESIIKQFRIIKRFWFFGANDFAYGFENIQRFLQKLELKKFHIFISV
uniref:Uncharacterized protein n=1 Tax=Romanomermis culicivorax TaxID=13658 RepID=A0A915KR94_ROMCU